MKTSGLFFAFRGNQLLARGALEDVARALREAAGGVCEERLALYVDQSGAPTDVDLTGSEEEMLGRLRERFPEAFAEEEGEAEEEPRPRGRPKLGVVSREVSLLPRHWQWLSEKQGGASAILRRLIDEERKRSTEKDLERASIDAAHRFMWDIAGNAPGFEEASRALYAKDFPKFERLILEFPPDVQSMLLRYVGEARGAASVAGANLPG